MEKLRTGIIGCGKVGDFHAKVYAELPQSEFVAVCDADSARAEAFASRYGVKAYTDVATMCRDARLDVVSISYSAPTACQSGRGGCGLRLQCACGKASGFQP